MYETSFTHVFLSAGFVSRWRERVVGWIRLILSDTNSRNLLGFLLLNLTFAFVELIYGVRRINKLNNN